MRPERTDATDDEDDQELRLRVRVPLWSSWLCPSHLAPKTLFQFPLSMAYLRCYSHFETMYLVENPAVLCVKSRTRFNACETSPKGVPQKA